MIQIHKVPNWPEVLVLTGLKVDEETQEVVDAVSISTMVRIQNEEGTWYKTNVTKTYFKKDKEFKWLSDFNLNVESIKTFGIADPSITTMFNIPVFELDEDQRSEKDRLASFLPQVKL